MDLTFNIEKNHAMFEIDRTILTIFNSRPQLKVTDGTAQNNVECLRLKQIMIGDYGLSKIKINFCCLTEISSY